MKVYPATVEEKLGFDVIRARLDALTRSALGQDRLAAIEPFRKLHALRDELARVGELQEAFRFDDPVPLQHVLDLREVVRRAAPEGAYLSPDELVAVRLVLITLRRVREYVKARSSKYPALAESTARIAPLPELEDAIDQVVDPDGLVRDDASPELRRIRRLIVQRQAELRETLMRALRDAIGQGYATEEQPTIRGGRMVIPVRAEAKRKIEGFVQDVSATGQTVYIEPASVLSLNNEVRELEADEKREVERLLRMLTAQLRAHTDAMRDNLRVLAQLDLLQAKATLANQLDAVVPRLNEEGIVDIRKGRNPVLLLHFQRYNEAHPDARREVVPLDLTLGEAFHTLVVTGPNAGGKTVAMKTVGLLALMLAYGLPVPLDPLSSFCLFDRLIVDIGDEQSIEEDLSTFSSHVANLKYMLQHADARTLVLIDEAGTGTDPAEGGALAQAVLEALTERGTRTIATTHHGTLKAFAHDREGAENGSMEFDRATLSPTYRFQPGIPGSSYAFEIAERNGLPKAILEKARALVGAPKTALEDLIATFEARSQELEGRLQEAEALRRQAEHEKQTYGDRARRLEKERDEIRTQALHEAERIVQEANARVERTIREIKEAEAEKEATKAARERLEQFRDRLGRQREHSEQRRRVEQARSERTARKVKKATQEENRPARAPARGPIQEGDQVVLDDGATAAEVLEIEGNDALVALGQMKMRVTLDRLTKVGGRRKQQVTVRPPRASGSDLAAFHARSRIDLRGQRVEEALAEVTRLIDDAVAANLDQIEILHGKGTGALRQAIHEYLATRPEVDAFEDAPWDQGGPGVTYVTLR